MGANTSKMARELKDAEIGRIYELMSHENKLKGYKSGTNKSHMVAEMDFIYGDTDKVFQTLSPRTQDAVVNSPDLASYTFGRDRAMMTFLLNTGLRIGELVKLKVGQVFQDGKVVDSFSLVGKDTKSGKAGWVYLNPKAKQALETYLALYRIRAVPKIIEREDSRQPKGYWEGFAFDGDCPLFPSIRYESKGRLKHLTAIAAANIFKTYFKSAGIPEASSHSFRRTFANKLRRGGVDVKCIQDLLRHAHLNTTMRYLQADEVELQQAVNNL